MGVQIGFEPNPKESDRVTICVKNVSRAEKKKASSSAVPRGPQNYKTQECRREGGVLVGVDEFNLPSLPPDAQHHRRLVQACKSQGFARVASLWKCPSTQSPAPSRGQARRPPSSLEEDSKGVSRYPRPARKKTPSRLWQSSQPPRPFP